MASQQVTAHTRAEAMVEFRDQLEARATEFANALPAASLKLEQFKRAALTSVAMNPKILNVDRRSLINALMRSAQDGLLPDGRQAALVIYKDRERGHIAQYQQMVGGVRVLVQRSGEISRFEQTVVYENDEFDYQLGDHPRIDHKPVLNGARGKPTHVYSVAQFADGTLSREVMTVEEVEQVRAVSRLPNSGPWVDWWGEMARKTVAKRHAKVLPMSSDAVAALARDDADHFSFPAPRLKAPDSRPRLAEQLDAMSRPVGDEQPRRRRGRPRAKDNDSEPLGEFGDTPPDDDERLQQLEQADFIDEPGEEPSSPADPHEDQPADFKRGFKDQRDGRVSCLNREIRDDPKRLAVWQRGFDAGKGQP